MISNNSLLILAMIGYMVILLMTKDEYLASSIGVTRYIYNETNIDDIDVNQISTQNYRYIINYNIIYIL